MEIFDILKSSVLEAVYFIPYIAIICGLIYVCIFLYKKSNKPKMPNVILKNSNDAEIDVFGLKSLNDEKKFKQDLEEIKKSIDSGNGQIRVEFSKAMYILKNFKDYNFYSSEDNKIIFEKLKTIIDNETDVVSEEVDANITERITTEKKGDEYKYDYLDDGSVKISYDKGYTIIKDNVVMESINYEEELKKQSEDTKNKASSNVILNEIEKRVSSIEEAKIQKKNKKEKKDEVKIIEDKRIEKQNEVNRVENNEQLEDMKNDIANHFANFNLFENEIKETTNLESKKVDVQNEINLEVQEVAEEISEDKNLTIKEKEIELSSPIINKLENEFLKNLKTEYEEFENSSIVFVLEQIQSSFNERLEELLNWIFEPKSLYDRENKFLFCDIDVDKGFLFIDANLFLFLFTKFYQNKNEIEKTLFYSGAIINAENLKKILNNINKLTYAKYNDDLFSFIGKTQSPFTERVLTYELQDIKRIVSSQMLMINLKIEEQIFEDRVYRIKDEIIGICKPRSHKISMKNNEKIKNLGYEYFKNLN